MKTYKQLLPMRTDVTVKEQFGWCPVSVFKPEKRLEWDALIGDDGDVLSTRRGPNAKYLPALRFSKFHPHLAEMVVKYWSIKGQRVVDPFAGRATRGIVSRALGREYEGYEIAPSTFADVLPKIQAAGGVLFPEDGCVMLSTTTASADLVFTCPPYHALEHYESAPGQLSDIVEYTAFLGAIEQAATNIVRVLKIGGFLCWVCADWRDGKAFRLFHADSLRIFSEAGLIPHDIVVVHNNSPFAPLQAGKVAAKRYTSKVHEYLLVFRKP